MAERSRWSAQSLIEYGAVRSLLGLFASLPAGLAYSIGATLGRAAFHLDARHRSVALENLRRAFPGRYTEPEIIALAKAVFEHLGRTMVDTARSQRHLEPAYADHVSIDDVERLRQAKARGKGVLCLTAHFGPWELIPPIGASRYEPFNLVVRPLDNPWLNDFFTLRREQGGNHVIQKKDAGRAILQALRRGESVGILIDQHIREEEGVVVPFFGRPASTAIAPALIAQRSGAAVFAVGILRVAPDRYRFLIRDEIRLQQSGDLKRDLVVNTAAFNAALEGMIREHPEQWFWVHRRWKTPHPLDPRLTGAGPEGA